MWSWVAPALSCSPPSYVFLPSVVVHWLRKLKRRVLGCGDASTTAFQSAVHSVYNTAPLVSPHQEILAIPMRLRLPSFKVLFPAASEYDELHELSQEGWV